MYLLALGSPTHPIDPGCYAAWCRTYEWKSIYGIDYLYAGPHFTHQLSHIWCVFRGIRDRFMREHDTDHFENSRRATLVQQQYAMRNPLALEQYLERLPACLRLTTESNGKHVRQYGRPVGVETAPAA